MRKHLCWTFLFFAQISLAQSHEFSIPSSNFTSALTLHPSAFHLQHTPSQLAAVTWEERPNSYAASTGIRTFVGKVDGRLVGAMSHDRSGNTYGQVTLDQTYDISSQSGQIIFTPTSHPSLGCDVESSNNTSHIKPASVREQPYINQAVRSASGNYKIMDGNYRIFRLAILVSQTDRVSDKFNNNLNKIKTYLAEVEAYLNELYVKELGIQFVLVHDDRLINNNLTSFQVSEDNGTEQINKLIGENAYDVGVIMAFNGRPEGQSGAPNRAYLRGCRNADRKGGVCVRDQGLVAFAHELGHHFGARHTFPGGDGVGHEPTPGQSAMGYNGAADFFSKFSLEEMMPNILYMDHRMDATGLPYKFPNTSNQAPAFDATRMKARYNIPKNSFFVLTLHASDPDGEPIVYGRQQESYSAVFPTRVPTTNNRLSFGREYKANNFVLGGSDLNHVGEYDFSFYVHDAISPQKAMAQHRAPLYDVWRTKINIVESIPFKFTSKIEKTYTAGTLLKLTWGVDPSFFPDPKTSKVRILMSDDGGKNFNHVLVPSTDNDGECEVYLPAKEMKVLSTSGGYGDDWDPVHKKVTKNVYFSHSDIGAGVLRIETIDDELQFFDLSNDERRKKNGDPLRGGIELTASPIVFKGLPTQTYVKLSANEAIPAAPQVTATAQNKPVAINFTETTEDQMLIRTWKVDYNGQTYGAQQFIERAKGDNSPIVPTPTPTPTPETPQPQPQPEQPKEVKISKITLTSLTPSVTIGDEMMIAAEIFPTNASNPHLKWTISPSNALQATNVEGNFIAAMEGTATIRVEATDGSGVFAEYAVSVAGKKVQNITLSITRKELLPQESFQLAATIAPDNATNKAVKWEVTQGSDVVSITQDGTITALKVGSATVRATAADGSNVFAECKVVVNARPVASITLNEANKTLLPQESFQLTANVAPDNATNKAVKWEVTQGSDVVSITQDGTITALKVGSATVRATAADGSNVFAECKVVVNARSVASITLNSSEKTLLPQETFQLTANVAPDNATNKAVKWEVVAGSDVISVSDNGLITAKAVGEATVRATATDGSGVSAQLEINVLPLLIQRISLDKTKYSPTVGDQFELNAEITPENATNRELLWWVSDQNVLENLGNGAFRALKVGDVVVEARATDGSQRKASCKITVVYPDGIAATGTNNQTLRLKIEGNTLELSGISARTWVEILNLHGQRLRHTQSKGDVLRISLHEMPQVLIVKVGHRSYKVVTKL